MRGDGYVPNFKLPGRRTPSGQMWLIAALCVVLPPIGLIALWWKARCPVRGKLLLTVVAVAVMVGAMVYFLSAQAPARTPAPEPPVTYQVGATPTPAAPDVVQPAPVSPADPVVPANPLG